MAWSALQRRACALATLLCALWASGCSHFSCPLPKLNLSSVHQCIQQTPGKLHAHAKNHLQALHQPHYKKVPPCRPNHHHQASVIIAPGKIVAPVGSEVILTAGVCGPDGYLHGDQRVEWSISSGGVGQFLTLGKRESIHHLNLLTPAPKKIDNTYAVGLTSNRYLILTRGTPIPDDDLTVQKGQAWISVTSPVEGTSHVTAFAPDVYEWPVRKQTAAIYWVDAQWTFPPPAINPVGTRHTFTTTVARQTDRAPIVNWRVRYEIVSGPDAGFAPDGSKVIEVPTNDLGQASVEIFQTQPAPGTNNISVQVIRPADSLGERVVLGNGSTLKTWTAPDASLHITGPAQAAVGQVAPFRIEVNNPSNVALRDVVITVNLPEGLAHQSTNPAVAPQGNAVGWRLGDLAPQETRTLELAARVDRPGTYNVCANMNSAEGLAAQNCASLTVLASATVDVQMTGPSQVVVGQNATFTITITNQGQAPLTGLRIKDTFDAGLKHEVATSPLERDLTDLAAGQSQRVAITLQALQPGRLCNRVEILGQGGVRGTAEACVDAVSPAAAAPVPQAAISVEKSGPAQASVGETVLFNILITNNGPVAVNDLRVTDSYDAALDLLRASDKGMVVGADLVWQIDTLPPGKKVKLQIECRCLSAADSACNRVAVTTREGAHGEAQACLPIRGAAAGVQPSGLQVSIADLRDPVGVGREVSYEIRITNAGKLPEREVTLVVNAPAEVVPIAPGTAGPSKPTISGQQVRFNAYPELRPGDTLTYQVRMRTATMGTAKVQAQVTSTATGATPVASEQSTTIFKEP